MLGITSGTTPKTAYLASSSARAPPPGRPGTESRSSRLVHQRGQVFAGEGQRGVGTFVAGRDVVVGDDAVDQHIGDAVDGGDQHHAHEQQRQPAGQQEQDLQRRLLVDAEGELKPAAADVVTVTSTSASASITGRGTVGGNIGPIIRVS